MCIELYKSIETLRLEINGPFEKLCDLMGTSSKIFITDKSVDVFSGGKEFDLHPRHDPWNAKSKRSRFKKKTDCRVSSRQAMQRDTISTQFFPSGSLKCASQNDLLKPWSSQSTGKQIWCRPSAPENESPVTLDVSPLPGTSEAISLLQVDGGETLQTRISRAAFAVEWRHVLTVRYYVKTCEGMCKICEDMKVLVRICGRKRQLLCLFHESRHNRSSDHNFRREFLRWWYWLTAS